MRFWNVFVFHRKMKARPLEMFHEMKMEGKENFFKKAISLLVKEFTWAEGAVPSIEQSGSFYLRPMCADGSKEGSVLSRTRGLLGWVILTVLPGEMEREQSYVSASGSAVGSSVGIVLSSSEWLRTTGHWEDPLINTGAGWRIWDRVGESILSNLYLQIQVK